MSELEQSSRQRVKWIDDGGEIRQKLELLQIKKQIEILATFLPDSILNLSRDSRDKGVNFTGVVLIIEITGCAVMCEKYNKNESGGIQRLTNTLNAYLGAIMEAIKSFGGEVLHFLNDGYQCIFKAKSGQGLYEVLHQVIVCSLFIRDTFGGFQTEVNSPLHVRMTISSGHLKLVVVGDKILKTYLLLGCPPNEAKLLYLQESEVVVGPSAWGHLQEDAYDFERLPDKNVKVNNYYEKYLPPKLNCTKQLELASNMCSKHLKHRETLHRLRRFNDTLTDFKITKSFMQDLTPRTLVTNAAHNWMTSELKPFVITPISYHVDEKIAVDYLTELREITLLYIFIEPASLETNVLLKTINDVQDIICKYVTHYLGHIVNVVLIEEGIRILASFSFRGVKHELESRNALRSANKIYNLIRNTNNVLNVSISVTVVFVYSGVLGHPYRREYCIIGNGIRKSWNYLTQYKNQIVCDYLTFKNSKLSSSYFLTLTPNQTILNEVAFQYKEEFDTSYIESNNNIQLLGRNNYMELINLLVHQPHKIGHVCGVCFKGEHDIGVSQILKTALAKYSRSDKYTVGAIELIAKQRPYYTVSVLYRQLYNKYAEVDNPNFNIIKNMPRDLWNFNEILQKDGRLTPNAHSEKKYKLLNLFKAICKGDNTTITILFIDNVQYIDKKSFDVIHAAMDEKLVRLVSGGCFEQSNWDILWKFSLSGLLKIMDVTPLPELCVAPLLCSMLNVKGVSKKLVSLIVKTFDGKPGYVQKSILRLLNTKFIEMHYIIKEQALEMKELIVLNEKDLEGEVNIDDISYVLDDSGQDVIPVGIFIDTDADLGNLSLDAIIFEEYSIFSEYQQLVIKTSAVLGESFSRILLMIALKHPHDQLFANTVKTLFEENVFDCGSKYMNAVNQPIKPLVCQCYEFEKDNEQLFGLPKYAFCKFIFFKNKTLRAFAYNLVPAYQRKELHLVATDIIENQNNKCPYCIKDNTGNIIIMRKFNELADACNENVFKHLTPKCLDPEAIDEEILKDWVREGLMYATKNHMVKIPKRRKFDSTNCFCLEMLTKVYADLVYHSKCAEHLGRIIFFQKQYGKILLTMNEVEDCIPLLTEASELCMHNSKMQYLTEEFRKICLGRIHLLLAEAHLILDNIAISKNHISISLRQYDSPMLSMFCKLPNKILTSTFLKRSNHIVKKPRIVPFVKTDFSICMSLVSTIFYKEGRYELAKNASVKALALSRTMNTNINILCNVYSTAIDLYSFCGDTHICEQLENNINSEILKYYTHHTIVDLLSICKLLHLIFQFRATTSNINDTIKLGYRTVEMNLMCQTYHILTQILPVLGSLLLIVQRIEDAVQLAVTLCGYSSKYDQWSFIGYFAFCMELSLECNFYVEPMKKVLKFVHVYFMKQGKMVESSIDNKLILLIVNYYLKNAQVLLARQWMQLYREEFDDTFTYISITNLLKRFENELLAIIQCLLYKFDNREHHEKLAVSLKKQCSKASKKWKRFTPRYLHLKAYYIIVRRSSNRWKLVLKKALNEAKTQNNILEQTWITVNQNAWKFGHESKELKEFHWTLVPQYSPLHWAQIMTPLPII